MLIPTALSRLLSGLRRSDGTLESAARLLLSFQVLVSTGVPLQAPDLHLASFTHLSFGSHAFPSVLLLGVQLPALQTAEPHSVLPSSHLPPSLAGLKTQAPFTHDPVFEG